MSEHEHHHDHGEDCDCGCHGHEHEHHHDHGEDCGCHDHEHHHDHGEDCGCGCHDHDHEHHHDHGEDCGCHGHEHEHHHDHGDDCGCGCHGHEHEHHHDHGDDCDCHDHEHEHHHDGIDITYHDMSMIGSMAGVLNAAGYEEGEKILAGQLREIGRRVNEAGGIIGHIKFVLTAQGQSCQISVTDEEESIRRFTSNSCHVEGVAIVFNLEEDTLRAILRETLGSVLTVSGS